MNWRTLGLVFSKKADLDLFHINLLEKLKQRAPIKIRCAYKGNRSLIKKSNPAELHPWEEKSN